MFGLGMQEILLLALLGGMGGIIALVLYVINRGGRVSAIEAENRRLREENEHLRGRG